jgi:hypothetical protein
MFPSELSNDAKTNKTVPSELVSFVDLVNLLSALFQREIEHHYNNQIYLYKRYSSEFTTLVIIENSQANSISQAQSHVLPQAAHGFPN